MYELTQIEKVAYDVPLCGDHGAVWFTARYFKDGDCWFCDCNRKIQELELEIEKYKQSGQNLKLEQITDTIP